MVGIAQNMITANKSIHDTCIKQGEITLCGKETSILNDQDRQLWAALTGIIFTQPRATYHSISTPLSMGFRDNWRNSSMSYITHQTLTRIN